MRCLHCSRHIAPAPTLQNGCAHKHVDTQFRMCDPAAPFGTWATPAPTEREDAA